jgi:hypothetical protein
MPPTGLIKKYAQPGDCLVYAGRSFWSWFIKVKTWSPASHVEVYIGDGKAVASRDGKGVNLYDSTNTNLLAILRPNETFDIKAALAYFDTVRGRKYDWWGLMRFFRIGQYTDKKMFCSEFATSFYRAGGFFPFHATYEPDKVSPGMYLASPEMDLIWGRSGDL